ncbi:DUF2069 domain-containing protein [Pseudoduganella umbonata]|uniref:DUF2069 domain-containing protein n=1 Tax=Pseudoduganella umbonata TaxID=864828 RepID=A0A4P8HLT3_9BURK|nr:DUF2069 domain-containing protein [Pseudoduganella umbonata]MBB3219882.1 putative membrane protein [Pseudoduganella umbonata]QCP09906.1 DUF2069 domain-containing protein [Pseudoduganella umbonata]
MYGARQKVLWWGALASVAALIALCLLWETVLAPLKPGGSWLALKAVPLLFPLIGVLKRDLYTLQWSSMMILAYLAEGVVRGYSDQTMRWLGWTEAALVFVFFCCALLYVHPYKRAAKKAARELLDKVARSRNGHQ